MIECAGDNKPRRPPRAIGRPARAKKWAADCLGGPYPFFCRLSIVPVRLAIPAADAVFSYNNDWRHKRLKLMTPDNKCITS